MDFLKLPLKPFLNDVLFILGRLSIINIKLYKQNIFAYFPEKNHCFHNLGQKFDIFNETPQVREAVNHTSGSLQIKVGGVLGSF